MSGLNRVRIAYTKLAFIQANTANVLEDIPQNVSQNLRFDINVTGRLLAFLVYRFLVNIGR